MKFRRNSFSSPRYFTHDPGQAGVERELRARVLHHIHLFMLHAPSRGCMQFFLTLSHVYERFL